MSVVDDYLETVGEPEHATLKHLYGMVRQMVPGTTEEMSYAMPAFKYKSKGLVAIVANKNFLSLYPFCSVERLGVDLSAFECTSGSIHFTLENPLQDDLLRKIISAKVRQIDKSK